MVDQVRGKEVAHDGPATSDADVMSVGHFTAGDERLGRWGVDRPEGQQPSRDRLGSADASAVSLAGRARLGTLNRAEQ
jgi:hypothetical protein